MDSLTQSLLDELLPAFAGATNNGEYAPLRQPQLTQGVERLEDAVPTVGLDAGLTLGVSTGLQLDCGINLGLAEQEVELNPFIGMALRM